MPNEKLSSTVAFKLALLLILGVVLMLALDNLVRVKSVFIPETPATGRMQVEVVDGTSEMPLQGATVIIPELELKHTTDQNGKTPMMELPILTDASAQKILPQPWGEVSILVLREGYIPYALFHAQVWPGEVRPGPRIYLFAAGTTGASQPFSVVEAPQRAWVNELISKYSADLPASLEE